MKYILTAFAFTLFSSLSFARCLNKKQNIELQSKYEKTVARMHDVFEKTTSKQELQKLNNESVALEKQIAFQEDHCL